MTNKWSNALLPAVLAFAFSTDRSDNDYDEQVSVEEKKARIEQCE